MSFFDRSTMPKTYVPSVFNMVKRLRFSMDEMDVYLANPDETPSASSTEVVAANAKIAERKQHQEEEDEEEKEPSPIKYKEGFPKILFHDLQSNNPKEVLDAARELDTLLSAPTASPQQLQEDFLVLGGHAILITTMQKWTNHGVIQSRLCRCIGAMIATFHKTNKAATSTTTMDLISSLLLMGALDEITQRAFVQYPDFPGIQLDAMLAISHLCSDQSESSRDAAKRFVRDIDGVDLVTRAMRMFADIEDMQENGCHLLTTLCRAGGPEEAAVMKAMALTVVAASVQRFPDNPSIEKDAHDLMNAVLSGDNKLEELD